MFFLQRFGTYPIEYVKWRKREILLLLNVFGGVHLTPKMQVAAEAFRLRAPLLALRNSHCSERNAGTALAQLCVEEGCFEERFLGLEFSHFARPPLFELVKYVMKVTPY